MLKCGYNFTAWLDSQGKLRLGGTFIGSNAHDISAEKQEVVPKPIDFQIPIISVACGLYHILCFDSEHVVWSLGQNSYGQLGLGNNTTYKKPQKIALDNIQSIHCGGYHSVCINTEGKLIVFGRNDSGQLGIGKLSKYENEPLVNSYLKNICEINCGAFHCFCMNENGNLYCFGSNIYGQLGIILQDKEKFSTPIEFQTNIKVQFFGCGYYHTVFCDFNGKVYCFGSNAQGRLGINSDTVSFNSPQETSLKNIKKISVCSQHTFCIDDNGSLWGFGFNGYGQLGLGDTNDRSSPVKVDFFQQSCFDISEGGYHSVVKDDAGDVWVFGWNNLRQLSIDSTNSIVNVPQKFEEPSFWGSIFRGKSARK